MDTERDENQNLKNNLDSSESNLINTNDTQESIRRSWSDNELPQQAQQNTDFTDDQNNSNTGYNEKLLEKGLTVENNENTENDSNIEDDLIVKNGIILDESNCNQLE